MSFISSQDYKILRSLAERYAEIAHLPVQKERIECYRKINDLEQVRPVVLIDEIPWGEIKDDFLVNRCSSNVLWLEKRLRRTIYQWEHFQADMVVEPVFKVPKSYVISDIGLKVKEETINFDTGTHILSHKYEDQLVTEEDIEKLKLPEVVYRREETEINFTIASEVFKGLLPVKLSGNYLGYCMWDQIARYRGVNNLIVDLIERPWFMHKIAQRFTEIACAIFKQMEELDLLDYDILLVHCTPACSSSLPAPDFEGKVRRKDVWGRCAAQIFGAVSPMMHDEFDLSYNQKLFEGVGLVYYGCCEPLHNKIDILRKRFNNLRKISITPWADADVAMDNIGRDYVVSCKLNPAFVAYSNFNPEPVEKEVLRYLNAAKRNDSVCEFILKDISTINNNPHNLTKWNETVERVLDRYW